MIARADKIARSEIHLYIEHRSNSIPLSQANRPSTELRRPPKICMDLDERSISQYKDNHQH